MREERAGQLHDTKLTSKRLMELHVQAMYTFDPSQRLLQVNEPWPNPPRAPRMFLTRSIDGDIACRFRKDLPDNLVQRLAERVVLEQAPLHLADAPRYRKDYLHLLGAEQEDYGPCYWIPEIPTMPGNVMFLNRENIQPLLPDAFSWLAQEISYVHPCAAVIQDGQVVSICRSVRVGSEAVEAGLETLPAYRGRGYAGFVVAAWASAVRKEGREPLYSTAWDNLSSQQVSKKLVMRWYGVNFTVW